jgi:hypothetical protein
LFTITFIVLVMKTCILKSHQGRLSKHIHNVTILFLFQMLTYKFILYLNHQFLTISQSTIYTISTYHKHHIHKDNVIHAHASFRSFTLCCLVSRDVNPHLIISFTPCQIPWAVNPHLINPFTPCCQVPWDVNPT